MKLMMSPIAMNVARNLTGTNIVFNLSRGARGIVVFLKVIKDSFWLMNVVVDLIIRHGRGWI